MNVVRRVAAPYRELLSLPAAARLTGAGFIWQMPMSMLSLSLVIFVEGQRGAYAFAGLLTGLVVMCSAAAGPALSWLIDRYSQRRVLAPGLAIHGVTISVLLVLIAINASPWVMLTCAVVVGLSWPPMEAVIRARWTYLLRDAQHSDALHRAFSWESGLDNLISVLGPVLLTALAYTISPLTACVVTVTLAVLGGALLLSQHESHPIPQQRQHLDSRRSVLRTRGMGTVAGTALGLGTTIGAIQVSVVAFTHATGQSMAAGWLLAAWGCSSMISGLIYGAVSWRLSLGWRFLQAMFFFAWGMVFLVLPTSVGWLSLPMVIAGATTAPALIAGFSLVERLVPAGRLTEGIAWLSAAMTIGYGVAAAVVGPIIDSRGARWALAVPVISASLGFVVAAAGYGRYRHARQILGQPMPQTPAPAALPSPALGGAGQ